MDGSLKPFNAFIMQRQQNASRFIMLLLAGFFCSGTMARAQNIPDTTVILHINLADRIAPMEPVWAWFGYDEPNYTYMKDGKKLLTEISKLSPVPVYVRTHSLLVSGDGVAALKWGSTNAYTEDASGNPVYDWTIIDRIFDTYVERGMKPLAQMGFMPEALSPKPQPYKHNWSPGAAYSDIYTGWATPPNNYGKWAELIYQWVKHSVERYGRDEVLTWYWELWNEPDSPYFGGTVEEYCKLYDYSVDAIHRALPEAKVGGPHVTGPGKSGRAYNFLTAFLDHCREGKNYVTGETGTPLDFIAFHAKGSPTLVNDQVQMNMGAQLRNVSNGFEIVSKDPKFKNLPIIIGESDPEGCAACSMADYPQNAYRNGTLYSSYTAAVFARKYELADYFGVNFKGAVTWAFEFEDQPWFNGFRDLATNGVDKPVLNVFRMFGMMKGYRIKVGGNTSYDAFAIRDQSVRGPQRDINALAASDDKSVSIMVWNYYDLNVISQPAPVKLLLDGIPAGKAKLYHYRIDQEHSNSYTVWLNMGSPQSPTKKQIVQLEKAGQLELLEKPAKLAIENGQTTLSFTLPGQGVSLLKLVWE